MPSPTYEFPEWLEMTSEHATLDGKSPKSNNAMRYPRRLRLFRNGKHAIGKVVLFPPTIQELLALASREFMIEAKRVFLRNGAEVHNILLLRDDEDVIISSGEPFIDPDLAKRTMLLPCVDTNHVEKSKLNEWISLNVGGRHFLTARSTLTKDPNSMLARMFSDKGSSENYRCIPLRGIMLCIQSKADRPQAIFSSDLWSSAVDERGSFLIDRTPEYVEPLLNYLRQGTLVINPSVNPQGVLEEAKFFGLNSVTEELELLITEREKKKNSPIDRESFTHILMATPSTSELRCQGINLAGADLSKLDLRYINFKLADLKGTNFSGANLGNSCFERADLSEACFDGASMNCVKMSRANLEGASLKNCNFEDPTGIRRANLEGANMKSANMEGSQMSGINLRLATLKGANMKNCVLHDAALAGADLEECNFTGSDLRGANLRGCNVLGTCFQDIVSPMHMVHLM